LFIATSRFDEHSNIAAAAAAAAAVLSIQLVSIHSVMWCGVVVYSRVVSTRGQNNDTNRHGVVHLLMKEGKINDPCGPLLPL
jgi:hypothetical protein